MLSRDFAERPLEAFSQTGERIVSMGSPPKLVATLSANRRAVERHARDSHREVETARKI